jgi:hypothetical protein
VDALTDLFVAEALGDEVDDRAIRGVELAEAQRP